MDMDSEWMYTHDAIFVLQFKYADVNLIQINMSYLHNVDIDFHCPAVWN